MAVNINQFGTTERGAANINVPDTKITALVTDEATNAVIADYTGDNALHFPAVLSTLTPEQRADLIGQIAQTIVLLKAGVG